MSMTVDTAFITQYDSEVKLAYQRDGFLRGTTRIKNGVRGSSVVFQKIGTGTAAAKARHGNVPLMNLAHSTVTATMVDRYAAEYVDALDELKINHDERGAIVASAAKALHRAEDDLIITAIVSGSNSTAISVASERAIRNSILAARQALQERNAFEVGMMYALPAPSFESVLLTVPEFKDADYVGGDLPYKSMAGTRTWLGINWLPAHTGLPLSTNTRTGAIWHKNAVGHAVQQDVRTTVDWVPEKAAYLLDSFMAMGSVLIDADGIQELTLDESSSLPTS